ncbi:uncharacterized protein LOC122520389 [Polistes fuscatus]|uniref:uncharacterized protein LOC122520389 n=1 Tax=Polistes fuscatus TaxID=30207 RepID=UPI001CA98899|nr:uncharacterized protein LOC122520389 [Polistes fuscatus]
MLNISSEFWRFWSDSTIVLAWLTKPSYNWKTFVANRVSEIQSIKAGSVWKHVQSHENPADIVSRGIRPIELIENKLWWNGPGWLPALNFEKKAAGTFETMSELRKLKVVSNLSYISDTMYKSVSHFQKIVGIHTWILRFLNNCRTSSENRIHGLLTVDERKSALDNLVKLVQNHHFSDTLNQLQKKLPLRSRDRLISLMPFLDNSGLLRVGGRLIHSIASFEIKHPIILPNKERLVDLLISYEHCRNKHVGSNALIAILRQKFWILNAKTTVKSVLNKCIVCFRYSPRGSEQLLGPLPKERLEGIIPFYNTGVDLCGPFDVRPTRKRGNTTMKIYVAIFICFASKAIHLEMVGDLSTDTFIAALRRFISRRGRPSTIFSDNATNFSGARNCLREWYRLVGLEEFRNRFNSELLKENIRWRFIPPRSPNFGGLWEATLIL